MHADREPHGVPEVIEAVAQDLRLTADDLAERIKSGRSKFARRVEWARYYLIRAGALESISRGKARITPPGRELLNLPQLSTDVLARFSTDFQAWLVSSSSGRARAELVESHTPAEEAALTPEERIDRAYEHLRGEIELALLENLRQIHPSHFEDVVVELLHRMGYGGENGWGETLGRTGDGGVDGVIRQDRLGLDVVYVQAKRWQEVVGRPVVQAFAGSLDGQRATKGVLITCSRFSDDARDYVDRIRKRIVLVDGAELARLMFDFGLGVAETRTYQLKRVDNDFFVDLSTA